MYHHFWNKTYSNDDDVEKSIKTCAFEYRLPTVLHKLRVPAGEDHNPIAPSSIAQHAPSVQNLIVVQGIGFAFPSQGPFEFAEIVIGRFAYNVSYKEKTIYINFKSSFNKYYSCKEPVDELVNFRNSLVYHLPLIHFRNSELLMAHLIV